MNGSSEIYDPYGISKSQEQETVLTPDAIFEAAGAKGFFARLHEIKNDPEASQSLAACARIPINLAITIWDMTPAYLGETTQAAKFSIKTGKHVLPFLKKLDPTPDVGFLATTAIETTSSPFELISGGLFPSHIVDTLGQAWVDWRKGRFENAGVVVGYLFTGKDDYLERLHDKGLLLNAAADVFLGKEK